MEYNFDTGCKELNVYMFNVASGACSIMEMKSDQNRLMYFLIDGGCGYKYSDPKYTATVNDIKQFMTQKKITTFELVIISHYDTDHMKMLDDLIGSSKIHVGQFVAKSYSKAIKDKLRDAKITKAENSGTELNGKQLLPTIDNFEAVVTLRNKKNTQKKLDNYMFFSASYDILANRSITFGKDTDSTSSILIQFLNADKSYFSDLDVSENTYGYDWRLASNNDSLVFVVHFFDKKILFCGDIQGNAMNDLMNKEVIQKFARNCDLVFWPHHGKIVGAELAENSKHTILGKLHLTTTIYRKKFTSLVANGEKTACFVSTNTKINKNVDKYWDNPTGKPAFDISSLVVTKNKGYYTSCLTGGETVMASLTKDAMKIYATKSVTDKFVKKEIPETVVENQYYDHTYMG